MDCHCENNNKNQKSKTSFSSSNDLSKSKRADMIVNGVVMDVTSPEEAMIASEAGACSVMALENVPSDIRKKGGVARMVDPILIKSIKNSVEIPVMAKCRIGHFIEAEILDSMNVYFIDESEVLTIADDQNHIDKKKFNTPFVCGCRNLREALRRISEGAKMIRTKGEAGTGNIVEAVRHIKTLFKEIADLKKMSDKELENFAKECEVPLELVTKTKKRGRLPVVTFAAGGVATPADAAMLMRLGVNGVFVGSGVFKSKYPSKTARAIVRAVQNPKNIDIIREESEGIGSAMKGLLVNDNLPGGYYSRKEKN